MSAVISKCSMSRHGGSVMVYCLGVLVLIALSIGYSFNASRVSAEKTRLQNTADAAAYSVAAVESRDLNFKSYTNRAMVANQVALAQSISLISWARFVNRFVENISHVASAFPPLRAFFAGISKGVSVAMQALETATELAITVTNRLEQILSVTQGLHHVGTIAAAGDIFNEVVQKNDPDVDRSLSLTSAPFMGAYLKDHSTFTKRYSPNKVTRTNKTRKWNGVYNENKKRMDEFRLVTLESRDLFSKNRTYDWVGSFTVIPRHTKLKIRKTGGSELTGSARSPGKLGNYYTWSAMDTMSVQRKRYKCKNWRCKWRSWKEVLEIGWGAAATGGEKKFSFYRGLGGRHRYASSYRTNRRASFWAAFDYRRLDESGTFNGLRAFYDIKQDGLVSEAPGIALLLTKPHNSGAVKTLKHTGFGAGSKELDLEDKGGFLNNRLAALSQAVPYFSRPNDVSVFRRRDKLREYGNLYNPFWQPRLSELKNRSTMLKLAATLL